MPKINQFKFFSKPALFLNVKEDINTLFRNKVSGIGIRLSMGLIIIILIINAVFWFKLPPQIPLFYSRPWGEDQLASKNWLLYLPIICLILILINFRIALLLYKNELLLAKILIWTSVILSLLLDITLIRILLIII